LRKATPHFCGVLAVAGCIDYIQNEEQPVANKKDAANKSKKQTRRQPKKQAKQPTGIRRWYRDTMGELRKVSWPTPREARSLTVVVVFVMVVMAIVLGGLDLAFFRFFELIWNL
jgi:preprotein translocase subunit SecE